MGLGVVVIALSVVVFVQAYFLRRYYRVYNVYDEWKDWVAGSGPLVLGASDDQYQGHIVEFHVEEVHLGRLTVTVWCRTNNGALHRWERCLHVGDALSLDDGQFNTCHCDRCEDDYHESISNLLPDWL